MSRGQKLRFSVVIPCYNEAAYIGAALKSLQQQDFKGGFEVIVVDNNSTDETAAIAKNLGAKVVSESRAGVCFARQKGTLVAQGEIIVSTDADTTFNQSWLSQLDTAFKKAPGVVAVGGPCRYVGGPLWGKAYARALFGLINSAYKLSGRTFYVTADNVAFFKSAWDGYDTTLTQGGDELDLLRRLKQRGPVVFDSQNVTYTSSRRLTRGFLYNAFFSLFIYYFAEYYLSRLFKRRVFGSAPAYRDESNFNLVHDFQLVLPMLMLIVLSLYSPFRHRVFHLSHNLVNSVTGVIERR